MIEETKWVQISWGFPDELLFTHLLVPICGRFRVFFISSFHPVDSRSFPSLSIIEGENSRLFVIKSPQVRKWNGRVNGRGTRIIIRRERIDSEIGQGCFLPSSLSPSRPFTHQPFPCHSYALLCASKRACHQSRLKCCSDVASSS